VYNLLGQQVSTLVDGIEAAGFKSVPLHAGTLASGVYFYRIDAQSLSGRSAQFSSVRKMMLIK
jgi:hypothetical protein